MSRIETLLSKGNSTTAALGAGNIWVGIADDLSSFQELDINIAGAPSIAPGTLYFEFSPDGTHWDVSVSIPLSGPSMPPLPLRVVLPRFRVRYENGATPLTELRLTTVLHRTGSKQLTRFLNQSLLDSEPIEVNRSVIAGRKADGSYVNVPAGTLGELSVQDVTAENTLSSIKNALTSLAPEAFDNIQLGYTGTDLTTVTYRSGTTPILTLTLEYSGGNLASITKS